MNLDCFKAYDIRGRVPTQLNERVAYTIARAVAEELGPQMAIVGRDVRLTSPALAAAVIDGLSAGGCNVADIGLCGTEEVYFATAYYRAGAGIMVTASHNPMDYNGLKIVREGARPVSADSGLEAIRWRAEQGGFTPRVRGRTGRLYHREAYIRHLLSLVDPEVMPPLNLLVNPGNGGAGPVLDELDAHLPIQLIRENAEPDGNFPNGIPNPMLEENRRFTSDAVLSFGGDLGLAWDGDFDRCFFFDSHGEFVEGYYMVGLLAEASLRAQPGGGQGTRVVHDPRLTWNTIEMVEAAGGVPVQSKAGHAFMKETMRRENAVYGGEMSAHHFFRDFYYCDSGMLPWLRVVELMGRREQSLREMVRERMERFPCSGEINFRVDNMMDAIHRVMVATDARSGHIDRTDGISVEFPEWRYNLRGSNTEPLLRLNVETRGDRRLLRRQVEHISAIIEAGV
ncbi:phosphomannomutase [Thioalkalivibrio halophilus]|uniref:phosphomannomutase n=1 Tax=Thioalkalivibrio halophilus TaxID=252474 RepID=A0A1V2ZWF0_9GAMM|nr:phosphomannomutase [Thioalkalivibrio halophilus]OOC09458.1 phosphomannomutase [Thioalkalivibrio halophilus]